jgi:predicted unusual protein kinase regulating ubiquinone biosynthesis (AarF/ABC1/UbiB family)
MATNIVGNVVLSGAAKLAQGQRPHLSDLLLTPANAMKLTQQLSNLRGAAMKLGQIISMDAGDFLPRELSDILASLRAEARHMPRRQLERELAKNLGADWHSRFAAFDMRPIAAASIGQVHRATAHDSTELAIKLQYPGIADSIDSDVDNVATLLRMSGLIPDRLDLKPMLAEAKAQLHDEADYAKEAQAMQAYGALLAEDKRFLVPHYYPEFSTQKLLAMDFLDGVAIESLATASQQIRNRVTTLLIDLTLRELFDFGLMQTDPNFANYRYQSGSKRIILLDFGAARSITAETQKGYRQLFAAGMAGDAEEMFAAGVATGLINGAGSAAHRTGVMDMLGVLIAPMQAGKFDFGNHDLSAIVRDRGMQLAMDKSNWHIPPIDTLFVQRKIGGMFMLASRLKAVVDVRKIIQPYVAKLG